MDVVHDFPGSRAYVSYCRNLNYEDAGVMIKFRNQA